MTALADAAINIPNTSTIVERFAEIQAELHALNEAASLDDFTTLWLPPDEQTALLAQTVVEHSEGVETVEQLFESLQQEFTQPEIPLEVAEVRLMSFHKSKGLSSPIVYIAGCVEGLIPSRPDPQKTPAENAAKLEEDRRLFYVAMTRVKADLDHGKPGYLHISYPRTMSRADVMQNNIGAAQFYGQTAILHGSRFLGELGAQAPHPEVG
jgi:superfamily I DNA/RNA helicase